MEFARDINDSNYCFVEGCTSNKSHVTIDHKCETCGEHGHGIVEHPHDMYHVKRNRLLMYYDDTMPTILVCQKYGCEKYMLHTTNYHDLNYK